MPLVFQYCAEIFPSTVRAFTLGIVAFISRELCSMIPFVITFTEKLEIHFVSVYLFLGLLGLLAHFVLPETKNKPLPE